MRFTWHPRRKERRVSRTAIAIATTGTAVMSLALIATAGRPLATIAGRLVAPVVAVYERLTYVATIPAPAPSPSPRTAVAREAAAPDVTTPVVEEPRVRGDTGSTRPVPVRPGPGDAPSVDARLVPLPTSPARTPLLPPPRNVGALTTEQRDSAYRELATGIRLAPRLEPTKEQRDSIGRETARRFAEAKDQQRPVAIPLGAIGGATITTGWLGRGPSREQRRRDSIVHHDNLLRLQRLADRVRVKQDSIRRADSIASLRTQRGDTTDDE